MPEHNELVLLAYHESGHAVSFYVQGFAVKFITIIPALDGSNAGRAEPLFDGNALDLEEKGKRIDILKRTLVCVFCGIIAEGYLQQDANPDNPIIPEHADHALQVGGNDLKDMDEILKCLSELGADADKCARQANQEAPPCQHL